MKKIDIKNGILEDGIIYHSVGEGSRELERQGVLVFGTFGFNKPNPKYMEKGWRGHESDQTYYVTADQAKQWNAYMGGSNE